MKQYKATVKFSGHTKNFVVKKDYYGNWSIYNADDEFNIVLGCPPFSVGHRTKKEAFNFLDAFAD